MTCVYKVQKLSAISTEWWGWVLGAFRAATGSGIRGPIQSSRIYGEFRPNRHPVNNFEITQNKHKGKTNKIKFGQIRYEKCRANQTRNAFGLNKLRNSNRQNQMNARGKPQQAILRAWSEHILAPIAPPHLPQMSRPCCPNVGQIREIATGMSCVLSGACYGLGIATYF